MMCNAKETLFNRNPVAGNQGQVLVETVLIMVVLLGISMMISRFFVSSDFVSSFTVAPWEKLQGLIECGNWEKCGVDVGGDHANSPVHILSVQPSKLRQ